MPVCWELTRRSWRPDDSVPALTRGGAQEYFDVGMRRRTHLGERRVVHLGRGVGDDRGRRHGAAGGGGGGGGVSPLSPWSGGRGGRRLEE